MNGFSWVQGGIVQQYPVPIQAGFTLAQCYQADFVAACVAVPDGVTPAPGWTVSGTTFTAPSGPSLADQAAAALPEKIAVGITVTCTSGTPFATATYALDQTTMDQLGAVARDDAAGLGLPAGASTFTYPDLAGTPHALSGAQVQALYKAQRDCLYALNTQAAVMKAGGSPSWPAQTATIP